MLNTAVAPRLLATVINEGNLAELCSALKRAGFGEIVTPVKRTFTGLVAAASFDLTTLDSTEEVAAGINGVNNPYRRGVLFKHTLRVTAGAAAAGVRALADVSATPTTTLATISNDGKTVTFEGNVTGFVIQYIPAPREELRSRKARGSITCVAVASLADNDNFTIFDGKHPPVIFEYMVTAGFLPVTGRVTIDVSALTTNAEVATATRAAINAMMQGGGLSIFAELPATNVIPLESLIPGAEANLAIIENVANAGFQVSGMSGGVTAPPYAPVA